MSKVPLLLLALSSTSCAAADEGGGTPGNDTGNVVDSSTSDAARIDAGGETDSSGGSDTLVDEGTDVAPIDAALDVSDASSDATSADVREVAVDTAPPTGLRIDEIYVDLDLSGDAVEFVELAGPVDASLDGLHLRLIDATGKVKYDVALTSGKRIDASGRWVVGGNRTDTYFTGRLDQSVGIASWGLDNTAGAVQLVSGTTLLDVVGYGAKVAGPSTPPTATFETGAAFLPATAKQSLARKGGIDTGNNTTDFCAQNGSPGSAGGACL